MHTRMRDTAYIWKSQDSFAESVLPPYTVVVGTELSSSRLGAKCPAPLNHVRPTLQFNPVVHP